VPAGLSGAATRPGQTVDICGVRAGLRTVAWKRITSLAIPLTATKPPHDQEGTQGPVEPPATRPDRQAMCHTHTPKSRLITPPGPVATRNTSA
jgi:hypothetical protein